MVDMEDPQQSLDTVIFPPEMLTDLDLMVAQLNCTPNVGP